MEIHSFRFLVIASGLVALIVLAIPVGLSLRRSWKSKNNAEKTE